MAENQTNEHGGATLPAGSGGVSPPEQPGVVIAENTDDDETDDEGVDLQDDANDNTTADGGQSTNTF